MESPLSDISSPASFGHTAEKKSSNFFIKLIKGILLFVFILITLSFTIAHFFEDEIKGKLVAAINSQLKTELKIESFTLSLLKGLPNVSAELSNVLLDGSFSNDIAPLLEASTVSFSVPLLQLFSDKIDIKSVLIKDATLGIYINSKGVPNYRILKPSKDPDSSSDFHLGIKNAILQNVEIIYTNIGTDITSRMLIDDATLSGNFNSDQYALQSIGTGETYFLDFGDKRFLPGNELEFDFTLDIDMKENVYVFDKGDLKIDGNKFNITGDVINDPAGFIYNLKAKSKKGNLATLFTFLPAEYLAYFKDYKSSGTFLFDMSYKGQKTKNKNPKLSVRARLKDGEIKSKQLGKPIKEVSFSANFNNGKDQNLKSSSLKISDFKGYFNKKLTTMNLDIYNLDDPSVDLEVDGIVPVSSVYKFFNQDMLTDPSGELEIQHLKVQGKQNDMRSMANISRVKVSGDIAFKKVGLSINESPFTVDSGSLMLKGNNIQVHKLLIAGADSDASFSGSFKNLIPVMFADSTNSQNAILEFESELVSEKMDLDQLVNVFTSDEEVEEIGEESGWHSRLSGFLDGSFDAYIKDIHYNKLKGKEFEGGIDFENDILTIDGDVDAMDGSMAIEGELYLQESPKLIGEIEAKNIDVYKFFAQSENFGQSTIIAKNLKGKMNANMIINAFFDKRGVFLTDKLKVYAGLEIKNGELVNLKMLDKFSTYIKRKDLRHIKFTSLENWFEIDRGKIYIPAMFIQSNAANLMVSGTHTFDHDINYNIQFNPLQIVIAKFQKRRKVQKDQRNGIANMHYTVVGKVDDYEVSRNRKSVQRDFEASLERKEKIRRVLEDSFGEFDLHSEESTASVVKKKKPEPKVPTPVAKPKPVKQEIIQAQLDDDAIPEFEVEEENVEYIQFQGDDGD
jgi:hypothetical protein